MVESPNPCLFVIGCPRSGTTLLARMLGAHPDLAIVNETHWLGRWYEKRKDLTKEGLATPQLLDRLLEHRKFAQHFGLTRDELERLAGREPLPYATLMSRLFDGYAAKRGKRLAGDKDPGYVKYADTLHELWPRARFVHLIRDGRDVALSAMSWSKARRLARRFPTWQNDPAATAALWWEYHVRLGKEAGARLGASSYRELRYEALVTQPEAELRAICAFLDLPYNGAMLRYHEGRTKDDPALDAKQAWLPPTEGLRDWRAQMSPNDLERFEAAGGRLLDELGYERAVAQPSPDALARAAVLRRAFGTEKRSRVFRLPERWGLEG
jgi:hypothetical protein